MPHTQPEPGLPGGQSIINETDAKLKLRDLNINLNMGACGLTSIRLHIFGIDPESTSHTTLLTTF